MEEESEGGGGVGRVDVGLRPLYHVSELSFPLYCFNNEQYYTNFIHFFLLTFADTYQRALHDS